MKIKDHPKVKNRWGAWSQSHTSLTAGTGSKFPSRNIGEYILKEARYFPDHVDLVLEHQGQEIHVSHPFDDPNFGEKFCKKLNADCIGKTVNEISEEEIDF